MLKQLNRWLGRERTIVLVGSLIVTGIASTVINFTASGESWALPVQTLLVLIFLGVATAVVASRLPPYGRNRLLLTVLPSLGLVLLGLTLSGDYFQLILGAAFGWLLAAQFLVRDTVPPEYKTAIKHLRNEEYKDAAKSVTELISRESDKFEHFKFRADMYRLAGQFDKAVKDYKTVTEMAPDSAEGYNGLAEVYLQQGRFELAKEYAEQSYEREPEYWVGPYNLGMIEDRLGNYEDVIDYLDVVLNKGLPDSRHRLLSYLWIARANYHLGNQDAAQSALRNMKAERKGLDEWQMILDDVHGKNLNVVLGDDIKLAQEAVDGKLDPQALFGAN